MNPAAVDRLLTREHALGAPEDPASPLSFAASLRLDEAEEVPHQAYAALRANGVQALFVPSALGGELRTLDQLVLGMRSVFRRDPAIGLGFGVTSLMAALPVWHSGTPAQKQALAATILQGDPVAVAFHEPAHGNDLLASEFRALPEGDGFVLAGQKNVVNNMGRAGAATLFARTGAGQGMREHSLLLLAREDLARGELLPRTHTLGARACELRGWRAEGLAVGQDAIVGKVGQGFEIAAQAYQVTRAVLPGMAVGIVDTAWRLCHRFLSQRVLHGGRALDIPLVRRDLAGAFVDLVGADAVTLSVARMAHVMPGQMSLASSVCKALVPHVLQGVMKQLAVMLGARHYVREGDYGFFQKLLRDLPVVTIGHASADLCLGLLVPQLPALARVARMQGGATPLDAGRLEAVFRLRGDLPPLAMEQLTLSTHGRDPVLQELPAWIASLRDRADGDASLARALSLAATIRDGHDRLVEDILQRLGREPLDQPGWLALARRYARLFAAACTLYSWHFNRDDARADRPPLPFAGAGFDSELLAAVERQLGLPCADAHWIAAAHVSMQACAEGRSAGLLRLPCAQA